MASLPDRPNTALLVIDVQTDVVANAHDRDAVVANIAHLVGQARAEGAPVIWVQHSDAGLPPDSESSPAHRPTPASARRCTGRSSGATT